MILKRNEKIVCFHLQIVVYFIREVLEEDASGSLQASVDDIVYKAKRRKLLEKITNVRLGMVGTATDLEKKSALNCKYFLTHQF